jgi:hypothetical protein
MAELQINSFSSWKLTDRETLEGAILNPYQEFLIQNDLAGVAEQIISNVYDPEKPSEFLQQDAYLKGQKAVLELLLSRSEESKIAAQQIQSSN